MSTWSRITASCRVSSSNRPSAVIARILSGESFEFSLSLFFSLSSLSVGMLSNLHFSSPLLSSLLFYRFCSSQSILIYALTYNRLSASRPEFYLELAIVFIFLTLLSLSLSLFLSFSLCFSSPYLFLLLSSMIHKSSGR